MDRDVFVENCLFALVEYYQEVSGLFFLLGLMAVKKSLMLSLMLSECSHFGAPASHSQSASSGAAGIFLKVHPPRCMS